MQYLTLYRKWRPARFEDVIGQESVTRTLKNQLIAGRVGHAYLFCGSRGTGKTTCARILAKAVNCENLQDGEPCGVCAACRAITDGSLLDVVEIDAATYTGVDNIRELRDDAVYAPAGAKKKVYIIDEVHMLSAGAFNAFLKILEEPPEHVVFVLATTELQKVPATVLSRCQHFDFRRIPAGEIAERLLFIAGREGIDLAEDGAALISGLADGAMRNALSILEQCAADRAVTLTGEEVLRALGLAGTGQLLAMCEAIAAGDAKDLLHRLNTMYAAGAEPGGIIEQLQDLFRDILIYKTLGEELVMSGVGYTMKDVDRLAPRFSSARLVRMMETTRESIARLSKAASRRSETEICLIRLADPALCGDITALVARVEELERKLAAGVFTPQAAPAAAPEKKAEKKQEKPAAAAQAAPPPPAEKGRSVEFLPELLEDLKKIIPMGTFPHLKRAKLSLTEQNLLISPADIVGEDLLKSGKVLEDISTAASARAGRPLRALLAGRDSGALDGEDPLAKLIDFGREHPDITKLS
ncbi:MAG: DNA polymerase III subunit gamma/tau [Clostridia bacterium]|nr:DNA polymerase III subunit gamma/tau [Clostridia bacterium]